MDKYIREIEERNEQLESELSSLYEKCDRYECIIRGEHALSALVMCLIAQKEEVIKRFSTSKTSPTDCFLEKCTIVIDGGRQVGHTTSIFECLDLLDGAYWFTCVSAQHTLRRASPYKDRFIDIRTPNIRGVIDDVKYLFIDNFSYWKEHTAESIWDLLVCHGGSDVYRNPPMLILMG